MYFVCKRSIIACFFVVMLCSFNRLYGRTSDSSFHFFSLGYGRKPIYCYEDWSFRERPMMRNLSRNVSLLYNRKLFTGKKYFIRAAIGLNGNLYSMWYIPTLELSDLSQPYINYSTYNIGLQTSASIGFKFIDRPKFCLAGLLGVNTSGTFISKSGSFHYSMPINNKMDTLQVNFDDQLNSNFYLSVFIDVMATYKPCRLSIGVKRYSPHAPDRLNINYAVFQNRSLLFRGEILDGYRMYQLYLCYHL